MAGDLREALVRPLLMLAYGPLETQQEFIQLFRRVYGPLDWPLQWVEGRTCRNTALAGIQTYALSLPCDSLQCLIHEGRVVGTVYEDAHARHCLLGGLGASAGGGDPASQTERALHSLDHCLKQAGLELADVARTWFYNDHILSWYPTFNAVRNRVYGERGFRVGSLPASTAVAGRNVFGASLQLAAWAVRPLAGQAELVKELPSPLQCPAPAYGSAFSRAVQLGTGLNRRILVSGTASIEPGGRTLWLGDVARQISLSMEVVSAILKDQSLSFADCTRAVAYFKDPSSLMCFEAYLRSHSLEQLPYVPVHCDICRDDLLFEIELDAAPACVSN